MLPLCLAEIERSRPYFIGLLGERYGWLPDSSAFSELLLEEQPWLREHLAGRSVTELADKHPDRSVAVVTHLGAIRALLPGTSPDHCEVQLTSMAGILAAVERQA